MPGRGSCSRTRQWASAFHLGFVGRSVPPQQWDSDPFRVEGCYGRHELDVFRPSSQVTKARGPGSPLPLPWSQSRGWACVDGRQAGGPSPLLSRPVLQPRWVWKTQL